MTATVGILCDCNHNNNRGNILLCADHLITYSSNGVPVSSNANGTKIYDLPLGFFVAIADDISRSHQVVSFLHDRIIRLGITSGSPSTTDKIKLALADTITYVKLWIRKEICADYGVSEDEFLHDSSLTERDNIRADLRAATISTELIVGGFGFNESPVFFFTNCIEIREETSPGIFCGGSGSEAVLKWLNFREQNCFTSTQRSYYHLREAMEFARISPVVGKTCATILLQPGENAVVIGADKDKFFLPEWIKRFFPPSTVALDDPDWRHQFETALGSKVKQAASQEVK